NSPAVEAAEVSVVAMEASLRRHYPDRFKRSAARARWASRPLSPVQPELPYLFSLKCDHVLTSLSACHPVASRGRARPARSTPSPAQLGEQNGINRGTPGSSGSWLDEA